MITWETRRKKIDQLISIKKTTIQMQSLLHHLAGLAVSLYHKTNELSNALFHNRLQKTILGIAALLWLLEPVKVLSCIWLKQYKMTCYVIFPLYCKWIKPQNGRFPSSRIPVGCGGLIKINRFIRNFNENLGTEV